MRKSTALTNRERVRQYILERAALVRPGWHCTRVSASALDDLEASFRHLIDARIHRHPTIGKTFRPDR